MQIREQTKLNMKHFDLYRIYINVILNENLLNNEFVNENQ